MTRTDFTWNYSSGGRQIYADLDNNFKDYNLKEVKNKAEELGIKWKGKGWSTCCPPNGNKRDIIKETKRWVRRNSRPRDPPRRQSRRSRSPPRRQSRPRSPRKVKFLIENDCDEDFRPTTRDVEDERDYCRDVEQKNDGKYVYYRTAKGYACCKRIPSKSDMKEMNKTDLQKLAEKVGLKNKGVGWPKCCPPKGNKSDIIKALDKFR